MATNANNRVATDARYNRVATKRQNKKGWHPKTARKGIIMKILYAKKIIEINTKEEREAEIYGSPAYLALLDAKRQFEGFTVEVKGKSKNTASFKGLNREFMKKHIEENPIEGKDLMAEFNKLCGLDNEGNKKAFAAIASFGELRMWFLNAYPEFAESRNKVNEILAKTREEIAAKRAA